MFTPLNNRVLIKPEEKSTERTSGLLVAEKNVEKPVIGLVIVGNDDVKTSDRVLFSKYGYDELTIDDQVYYVVSSLSILGILK